MQSNVLCEKPNQYARPAGLRLLDNGVIFYGYQEFFLTRSDICPLVNDHALNKKADLLSRFFQPKYFQSQTVLDLGANSAFYCFWALQQQAKAAVAVDIDNEYLDIVKKARDHLGIDNLEVVKANVEDWSGTADIVIALALVHWVYSSTSLFGSLSAVIERLSLLTNYLLIVEWIAPEDPAIQFFDHINWNKDIISETYSLENFEKALHTYFGRIELVGEVSATRKLYVAYKTERPIFFSPPFPLLFSKEHLLSSQLLAQEDGIVYWSCVFEHDQKIYKQATLDLASREAEFLSDFNSDYFPKVFDCFQENGYSVAVIEKVVGDHLRTKASEISRNLQTMYVFIEDCLNILVELNMRGFVHRDIRMDNIMVRDQKPVLLDFGWAWSETRTYLTPRGLGDAEKPADGIYCDVYSMGKVLEQMCQSKYPYFMEVIALMVEPDSYLRIHNPGLLKKIFAFAHKREAQNGKQ
jgi:tRNA A-37 threonylcarbamoyl transferase component Bud32